MDKKIIECKKNQFDDFMQIVEDSEIEFWYARDLMKLFGYEQWRNFENAISKAMKSCKSAQIEVSDHFAEVSKMVMIGSGAERKLKDYMLTRKTGNGL